MNKTKRFTLRQVLAIASVAITAAVATPAYAEVNTHQSGAKFSHLDQINRGNISQLELAWEYHTGDLPPADMDGKLIAFEDQPSLIDGNLVVCTPTRQVIAVNPKTGKEQWRFDPKDPDVGMQKCRGISHWVDQQSDENALCHSRIFLGTADYRLIALDGKTGKLCPGFGNKGQVKMPVSIPEIWPGEVIATSNPAVVNDVVVVGSAVADNQRVNAPSGRVLAYDARTGEYRWEFDPVPRDPSDPASKSWPNNSGEGFGGGNVWSSMAVDNSLDLVFLPTTSSSSDFFGGERAGDNHYTTSVVALQGSTGKVVWHQQLVHHNVFDYDVPSRPMLVDYPVEGKKVKALVQNTKMGLIFVFDRATGEPLVPIEERPVPQEGAVEGEMLSPTQPFPVGMPTLAAQSFSPDDAWGFTFIDKWLCKRKVEKLRYGPIYTPASLQGTIFSPSAGGGPNWGGGAFDPASNIMVVPSNRVPMIVRLIPRAEADLSDVAKVELGKPMVFDVKGSNFIPEITPLLSPLGAPCSEPPWAVLTAVDMAKKEILWEVPLGDVGAMMGAPFEMLLGTPGAGGPLTTAGGLVFIGYSLDDTLRAFDLKTGNVVWSHKLPAGGNAVPVTYDIDGEQYLFFTAGGHSMYQSTPGDSVLAYKLKK